MNLTVRRILTLLMLSMFLFSGAHGSNAALTNTSQPAYREFFQRTKVKICIRAMVAAGLLAPWISTPSQSVTNNTRDVSLAVKPGMLRYPDDPDPVFHTEEVPFNPQVSLTMSRVELGLHVGTHIDSPGHFVRGAKTIDKIPSGTFVGEVLLLDLSDLTGAIHRSDLAPFSIPVGSRVFIRTRNSAFLKEDQYRRQHVYLAPDAAAYLANERKVQLFGFDYFNIDNSSEEGLDSHLVFARAGIPVICAMDLTDFRGGRYNFSAAPLRLQSLEASPVTVLIWDH